MTALQTATVEELVRELHARSEYVCVIMQPKAQEDKITDQWRIFTLGHDYACLGGSVILHEFCKSQCFPQYEEEEEQDA